MKAKIYTSITLGAMKRWQQKAFESHAACGVCLREPLHREPRQCHPKNLQWQNERIK